MSLNPGGNGSAWNYTKPEKEGFSLELTGTVVSLQEVQARMFNPNGQPGAPRVWPDGNPVMNIRMGLAAPDGSLKTVTFPEAGKAQRLGQKPSLHMQLYALTSGSMMELVGKTVHLWTWPANPETGATWGQGNPRLFGVELVDGAKYELVGPLAPEYTVPKLLCNDGAQGGQPVGPSPQMIQQPQMPPMQGQFYAPPTMQPQYQQPAPQYQQQAMPMQPQYQQPMPMPQQYQAAAAMPAVQAMPPQSAPMPQGMDPAVAAAMQVAGAVNVQQFDDPTGGIYDDGIPF